MGEIIVPIVICIVVMLAISALAFSLWRFPFVSAVLLVVSATYCCILSFGYYGDVSWGQFWSIEAQRFVAIYAVFVFNAVEIYNIKDKEGHEWVVYWTPHWSKNAGEAAGLATFFVLLCDLLISSIAVRSFAYLGIVALIFAIPSIIYIIRDIQEMRER